MTRRVPATIHFVPGRVITYAIPDAAGRLTQATGVKSGEPNRTYVSNATYASHGPVNRMQLGGLDRYYQIGFNSRLQTTSIQFGTNASPSAYLALTYGYGTTTNNGNVLSQSINAAGTVFSQTYGYDDINRLKTFTESSTVQTYCYDRYGNRAMLNTSYIVASALTPQVGSCTTNGNDPNLPFTNNRTNNGNQDAAGNVRWDGATTYAFDAENRITSSTRTVGSLTTAVNYKYDGDGRRVRVEVTGGASTNFVYDAGGKLLAEYNSQNYPESGTRFRIGDHLGSTRLLFDASGNILQRFDYLPFGEELLTSARTTALKYGVASILKQRFTGQKRDAETNLDYFNARYLSPNQGRFMSVDPGSAGASVGDPQSWNAYSYTINNPLLYVDPDGLAYMICQTNGPCGTLDVNDVGFEEYKKANPNLFFANGHVYVRNDGGRATMIGSYSEISESFSAGQIAFIQGLESRRVASNQAIGAFAVSSAAAGAAWAAVGVGGSSQIVGRGWFFRLEGHHAVPRFLGGARDQILSSIPRAAHRELHVLLRAELRKAGIPLNIGGRGGSILDWAGYFARNPGSQQKAIDALLKVSRQIDVRFGSQTAKAITENLGRGNWTAY